MRKYKYEIIYKNKVECVEVDNVNEAVDKASVISNSIPNLLASIISFDEDFVNASICSYHTDKFDKPEIVSVNRIVEIF